ncbi:hypothetical protein BDE02_17G016700 [Populus trichocarpa]|nr:hypothetical protein BDE02_17G016700 [Populus trichocarpa]
MEIKTRQKITCITRDKKASIIGDLLKFTLESQVNQTLEFNLGLSKEFCINLLEEDPNDMSYSFDGVAQYPLYKRFALYHSVTCGALWRTYVKMMFCDEDNGSKTVEGRCATGDYIIIGLGDVILVNKTVSGLYTFICFLNVHRYASFLKMLHAESLEKVLPGVKTVEEGIRSRVSVICAQQLLDCKLLNISGKPGVKIYRKLYAEEKEVSNGVLAICVSKLAAQPYLSLASILFGLSYGGVQSQLGTAGSALAKHAERSSNRFQLAMDVINRLIAASCWQNIHAVPQHGAVFGIRVVDGYGAR